MNIQALVAPTALALSAAATLGICAGSCSDDIKRMMVQINAKLAVVSS